MNCYSCGTPNPAQARYCYHCGTRVTPGHVCQQCQTLLPTQANYCFHCGNMVIKGQPQMPHPLQQQAPPPQQQQAPPPEAPELSLTGLLPALKKYLPETLYEPLERRPKEDDIAAVRDHLIALLRTTKTYLPAPVIQNPQPAGQAAGGMQRGTFLFVDVSGFTALSERLSVYGREGAERVTDIMNDLFFELVGILMAHGGSLLKFGGDAILGLFSAESDADMAEGATLAVQAAFAMQAIMEKFSAIEAAGETSALYIKCGISSGEFFAAHIGTTDQMGFVTTGFTVNESENAEDKADPGDIIAAPKTYDLIKGKVQAAERESFYHLTAFTGDPITTDGKALVIPADDDPPGTPLQQVNYLTTRMELLSLYLAADLLPRMVTNPDEVEITPEHRPVTVMFVNYVGLSELIADLGDAHPALITEQLNTYFAHMADIVEKYEGTLARMDHYAVGDRLVIFFGAPRAHEDDPVRAVYTALEMQKATQANFSALQTPEGIYRFRQRIGINTGKLFAGNVGAPNLRQEYTLMGDDINMAARLMSKADWKQIFISRHTHDRVKAFFELQNEGDLKVKGKEILIPTYSVTGRRQEVGQTRGLEHGTTPLIGREEQLHKAIACGDALLTGRGQILSITGDSGRGKSRLTAELRQALAEYDFTWIDAQALSFSEQVSYWLAADLLYGALGLKPDANTDDVLFTLWEKGEELLGREDAREAIPFLAYLLGLELEGEWADWVSELDPRARQKQTFWATRQFFGAMAEQKPLLIALDDLHWADEASLAMLQDLLSVTDRVPLMILFAYRQRRDKHVWDLHDKIEREFTHRFTHIALPPLDREQSRTLLAKLIPGAQIDQETEDDIMAKSAGNPFYLEEVVRTLIESKAVVPDEDNPEMWTTTDAIQHIAVPDTLHGAIVARMDRLTEDTRQALQMASVIGRRFQAEVFRGIAGAQSEMEIWLAQLERSGMLAQNQQLIDLTYDFPDALIQEVAYESMLAQRRDTIHERIGETLEDLFSDNLDQALGMLAYHYSRSDNREKAIYYLEKAGRHAQREFANQTAIANYTDLLKLMGDDDWEKTFEILNQRQQIYGLVGQQEEREADLNRMLSLAEEHNDEVRRADALNGLADLFYWTSRYDDVLTTAKKAFKLKQKQEDKAGQAAALHQIGVVNYSQGDFDEAQPVLKKAAELRHEVGDASGASWSRLYMYMIHLVSGRYSEALTHQQQALSAAKARHDWMLIGIHLNNGARIATRLGEYETALAQYTESTEIRRRIGDRTGEGFTTFGMGQVNVYMQNYDEALYHLETSLTIRQAINDERGISYCYNAMGLAHLGQGEPNRARVYLEKAKALHESLEMQGELISDLSWLGQVALAEDNLEQALSYSQQAMDSLEKNKNIEDIQQIYLNHYKVLQALERNDEAQEVLALAEQAIESQAAAIVNEAQRETFLTKVSSNKAIQAALA